MERKSARGIVELMGAYSEVCEDAVCTLVGELRKYALYIKEVVVDYADILSAPETLCERLYRFGVAVNGDEPAVFRESVKYRVRAVQSA